MTFTPTALTEDEKLSVEGSAQFVLEAQPMNLRHAYEIFERFCDLNGIDAYENEECEAIFNEYANYYGLVKEVA